MERVIDEISEVIAACFRRCLEGDSTEARRWFVDYMRELQYHPDFSSGHPSSEGGRCVPRGAMFLDDIEEFAGFIATVASSVRAFHFEGMALSFGASEADAVVRKLETLVDILERISNEDVTSNDCREDNDQLLRKIGGEDLRLDALDPPRGDEDEEDSGGGDR